MTTSAHIEALEQRRLLTVIGPNPHFGTDGVVTLRDGDEQIFPYKSIRTIVQVDGDKLLLIGDEGAVVFHRLNADGSTDTSFGQNGTVSFENTTYDVLNVAVLEDQKLILEMFNYNVEDGRLELWRFNADGTRDYTFGQGGAIQPAVHQVIGRTGLEVDADGKILLGATLPRDPGATSGPDSLDTFAIERFNPDGTLDTSFGDAGMIRRTDAAGVQAMALDAQGRLLAIGLSAADESFQLYTSELFRFLPSGQLDTSFASGGIIEVNFEDEEPGSMVRVAPDGKIVLVKQTTEFGGGFWIDRFDANGARDETFGEQGEIAQPDVGVRDLFIAPGGGITAALQVIDGRPYFRRYNADGSVDTSFNDEGAVLVELAEGDSAGPALVLDADTIVYEIESEGAPRLIELASRTPGQSLHDRVLTIIGSDENDEVTITRSGGDLLVALNDATEQYVADQVARIVIFSGDGDDSVTGSEADDDISLTAQGLVLLDAREGDDRVSVTGLATVFCGDGDDTLVAYTGGDSLFGEAGDDFVRAVSSPGKATWVYGSWGNDTLFAGEGDDTLIGGGQRDRLYGGGGNDFLLGCGGNDRLFGGGGDDTLHGARGNDYLAGFDGDDTLVAGPGNNILHGDNGDDTYFAHNAQVDELFGGDGTNFAVDLDIELDVLTEVGSEA